MISCDIKYLLWVRLHWHESYNIFLPNSTRLYSKEITWNERVASNLQNYYVIGFVVERNNEYSCIIWSEKTKKGIHGTIITGQSKNTNGIPVIFYSESHDTKLY